MTTETTTPETIPASVAISAPNADVLKRGASSALELVQAFEVVDTATFEIAADELRAIKAKKDSLGDQRMTITRPLDAAKAAVMALFKPPIELLEQAEGILKGKMLAYQRAEQEKAREAQLVAERAAQAERDRLNAEAEKLAAEGRSGEAAVKQQVAQMVVAPPPAVAAPAAVKGISTSTTVDFEVADLLALVKHVAAHPELINLISADTVKVRAYVRGLGLACNLPGVRVFEKQTLAARKG